MAIFKRYNRSKRQASTCLGRKICSGYRKIIHRMITAETREMTEVRERERERNRAGPTGCQAQARSINYPII